MGAVFHNGPGAASPLGEIMKEVNITLYELTREEAAKLPTNKQYLFYNSFMNKYGVERAEPGCLARSKHAASYVKYFIFDREGCDEK